MYYHHLYHILVDRDVTSFWTIVMVIEPRIEQRKCAPELIQMVLECIDVRCRHHLVRHIVPGVSCTELE